MHAFLQRTREGEQATGARSGWPGHRTGRKLDPQTQSWAQRAFQFDFSKVRLHDDSEAASARGAAAFALGNDIVLGREAGDLASPSGRRLLAHELTHVVQQAGRAADAGRVEPSDSPAEREAHAVADRVAAGERAPRLRQSPTGVPRAPLTNTNGDFAVTGYTAFDGDKGKDTKKTCGVDITISFTPAKTLLSDKISFVQIMRTLKGGTPLLFANEKPRATSAKDGEAGWAVDMIAGNKFADYQIGSDGKAVPSWGTLGHRKSDTDFVASKMIDGVRLDRDAGETFAVRATSFALDKTHSTYLGGIGWGYDVDKSGAVTKVKESITAADAPAGVQKTALTLWNEQAKNPDKTKRNHPDQAPITVP